MSDLEKAGALIAASIDLRAILAAVSVSDKN